MIELGKSFLLDEITNIQGVIPFEMDWVEAGEFTMGKHEIYESLSREVDEDSLFISVEELDVIITKGFWMSKYLITQYQWSSIMNEDIKFVQDTQTGIFPKIKFNQGDNYPIYSITWLESIKFCQALNIKFKDKLPEGYHFNLPTEIHWEYTCKASEEMDDIVISDDVFYDVDIVGKNPPNSWGFYDMLGNIRQWCYDIAAYFPDTSLEKNDGILFKDGKAIDWIGNRKKKSWYISSASDSERVIRGYQVSVDREYACHTWSWKDLPLVGFRVALRPITEWDLNDPLLKREGINILGD